MKNNTLFKSKYFQIWKSHMFGISFHMCGYNDYDYPELCIGFLFLEFMFIIPIKTKYHDEWSAPTYEFYIFENALTLKWKRKTILWWQLPFFTWEHMKHKAECHINVYKPEIVGYISTDILEDDGKSYQENETINKIKVPYKDSYDGEVVNATIWKEYRIWKRKWLTWLPFKEPDEYFDKKLPKWLWWTESRRDYIEIEFDKGVGRRKNTWKGGCIGCSYDLLPNEGAIDCLLRMEKEKQFY